MKFKFTHLSIFIFAMLFSIFANGKTFTSIADTDWNLPSTWDDGTDIPGPEDDVIIQTSVTLNLTSIVTILSLKITNESNTLARLIIMGSDTLEVLTDLTGFADNKNKDVDLQVKGNATLYVHGNANFERSAANNKPNSLRIYLYEDAKTFIKGDFNFNYQKSHNSENEYEIFIEHNALLDVAGMTKITCADGNQFDLILTDSATAIFRDSMTILLTDARGFVLNSKDNAHFQANQSVYMSNTNGTKHAIIIADSGGKVTIRKDITLEATSTGNMTYMEAFGVGSEINIQGDLIMNPSIEQVVGIYLTNEGSFFLGGDINRPTEKGFLEMGPKTQFVLNGSQPQSIPDSKLPNSGQDSLCFRKITFANTSGVAMDLAGDFRVEDTLFLNTGKIKSSPSALLILENKAVIKGGDESNYIIGPVLKKGTADSLFLPIGTTTKYAPMQVSAISDPAASMTVTYHTDPPPFGTNYILADTLNNISMIQHWEVVRTAGSDDLDYTLHWMDQTANGINDTSGIVVVGLEGLTYESYGRESIISNGTEGSVTSAFTDPPPFGTNYITIGSTKGSNTLPVELTKFQAVQNNEEVYLQWETATEIRTSHFEVQHATDGENFKTIQTVEAKGDSNTNQIYSMVDKFPQDGMNYYRIKIIDIDDSYEFSKVRIVNFDTEETTNIFPNPVEKEINIVGVENFGKDMSIKVFDKTGRELYNGKVEIENGTFQISTKAINVNATGTYFLHITGASKTKVLKFIKVK